MKEYIIHGTQEENLEKILKNGYINPNVKEKDLTMLDKPSNQIFTQLLYRDLPNEDTQTPHYGMCCLVLDKNILRDFPFYATYIGGFLDNFNNAFSKDKKNTKDEVSKNIFVKGSGHLKKRPNLKKLKKIIEYRMKQNTFDNISFMYSHEILFNKKISLKKYCKYILYKSSKIPDSIIKSAFKLKIPIKSYDNEVKYGINKFKGYGLNNFIDLIEK